MITGIIYPRPTLLYNQARWLPYQRQLGGGAASTHCQGSISVPPHSTSAKRPLAVSGVRDISLMILAHKILTRPITSRSDITLRTQDTIDKSSFLLRHLDEEPAACACTCGPPAKRLTFKEKGRRAGSWTQPRARVVRTNSADSLVVLGEGSVGCRCLAGGYCRFSYLVLHALAIMMSSNARRERHTCPEGRR